jgi:hypothetical protein
MSEIDSERVKTWHHIDTVRDFINQMIVELMQRGQYHDASKLESPEAEAFAQANSDDFLKGVTYGSDEYKSQIKKLLGPALDHHYALNAHHPEHHDEGVDGMTLIDLCEMLCDWKAATLRHDDGDIERSIEINKDRFKMSPQLTQILANTAAAFGWVRPDTE